ncbi:MAG: hypothetical protein IPH17_10275 [Bacteroidales bacterium]|nr:hypothetical protein [Bacteroidales bacterium]MBK6934457.1 hypothetical protein [Bacteroidales bacterium]MBK6935285.1 hypothetical protein [Bacteroidales bacterium]MBK6935403.1 hypothetical protein [Bacteroidales bacterium]
MKEIVDNLEEYLSMSKQENLEFLDQLYHLMNQINADAVDYQGLKIHHHHHYVQIVRAIA